MKQLISPLFVILLFALTITAQTSNSNKTVTDTATAASSETKKRPPVFRASKDHLINNENQ